MPRLLFEKTGKAVWISHLDIMRVFQRGFKRAGLPLTHTQGYNPRPSVSIALPLSVGVHSRCELLDFDLERSVDCAQIKVLLNNALIEGVRVLDVYNGMGKLRALALMDCTLQLTYDAGVPENAAQMLRELFNRPSLIVEKKGKKGITQQDIIPLISAITIEDDGDRQVRICARICCQNPSLNPMQLIAAIEANIPVLLPDHCVCTREELYDAQGNIFR